MAYIFKFANNDIFINAVKTNPECNFTIYQGAAYYNNHRESGSFIKNVLGAPPGYISLYEQNVDRTGSSGMDALSGSLPVFEHAVQNQIDPRTLYGPNAYNPKTQPFIVKDGTRIGFNTVSTTNFNSATSMGEVMTENYPLSSSISREWYPASLARRSPTEVVEAASGEGFEVTNDGTVSYLFALVNTLNYYQTLSPHYAVSSSIGGGRDLTASSGVAPGLGATDVGMISIPSIFYGSQIKKGSLNLKFFISGTLVGELRDPQRNGNLIQVGPVGSNGSGSVAGVALYTEGFIILTGSWSLDDAHTATYAGSSDNPKWKYFADTLSSSTNPPTSTRDSTELLFADSSSYQLTFKGTEVVPTLTMFAHAQKNTLNHSNNTTAIAYGTSSVLITGSGGYFENDQLAIKNVVSSAYNDPTGSFKKTTYISKIAIYDENRNVLGVVKLATPVKKTEDRDITFKLKLDI